MHGIRRTRNLPSGQQINSLNTAFLPLGCWRSLRCLTKIHRRSAYWHSMMRPSNSRISFVRAMVVKKNSLLFRPTACSSAYFKLHPVIQEIRYKTKIDNQNRKTNHFTLWNAMIREVSIGKCTCGCSIPTTGKRRSKYHICIPGGTQYQQLTPRY